MRLPPGTSVQPLSSRTSSGRISRQWLTLARGAWIVCALLLLVIFVANLPAFFQYARTVCTLPDVGNCPTEQLTPAYVQVLNALHLSVAVAESFLAALCVAVSVVYWLLGLLIFWRKSQERIALLVSLWLRPTAPDRNPQATWSNTPPAL